jgi:hypothetical protein
VAVRAVAARALSATVEEDGGDLVGRADGMVDVLARRCANEEAIAGPQVGGIERRAARRPEDAADGQEGDQDGGRDAVRPWPRESVVELFARALPPVSRPLVAELAGAWISRSGQPRSR